MGAGGGAGGVGVQGEVWRERCGGRVGEQEGLVEISMPKNSRPHSGIMMGVVLLISNIVDVFRFGGGLGERFEVLHCRGFLSLLNHSSHSSGMW